MTEKDVFLTWGWIIYFSIGSLYAWLSHYIEGYSYLGEMFAKVIGWPFFVLLEIFSIRIGGKKKR